MTPGNLVNKLIKPLILTSGILVATSFFNPQEAQAQIQTQAQATKDTIWGSGNFRIRNIETNGPVENANIACTPINIPGDTTPDIFTTNYTTNEGGFAEFNLPAWIDIYVGVPHNLNIPKSARVIPNPSSDFTFAVNGEPLSDLVIYNISGQEVAHVPINYDNSNDFSAAYINMSDKSEGTYVYRVITTEGVFKGKIIKNGNSPVGNLVDRLDYTEEHKNDNNLKSLMEWTALYDIEVTAEGYETFSTEQEIDDGYNGLIPYYMTPEAGIPQYQYIGGYTYDEDGNGLVGVTVRLVDDNSQLIEELVTNTSGKYTTSEPIDVDTDFTFEVGGLSNKFSYVGDEACTPSEITVENDTITEAYRFVMYDKSRQVPGTSTYLIPSAMHIKAMTADGHVEAALRGIKYWLGNGWNESQKQLLRNNYDQLEADIGFPEMYDESPTELNQDLVGYDPYTNPKPVGTNIEPGTNNTSSGNWYVTTPLGNVLLPAFMAEMTLAGGVYLEFAHENGRAAGLQQVSWPSIMDEYASIFTDEDKVIWNLDITHSKNLYEDAKAYFTLDNIADDIPY